MIIKDSNYLAESLIKKRDKPWVIFAGSAISLNEPSNLPSVDMIKNISIKCFKDIISSKFDKNDKDEILKYIDYLLKGDYVLPFNNIPFETFMRFFYDNIPGFSFDIIIDLFGLKTSSLFNINHNIIALLIKEKFIRQVVTTNYDLLLEEALKEYNIENSSFIIQDPKNTEKIRETIIKGYLLKILEEKPIIKLHGCCSIGNTLVFTEENIDKWKEIIYRISYQFLENTHTIFIGYSGKDYIDIMPAVKELSTKGKIDIYWLALSKNDIPKDLNTIAVLHNLNKDKEIDKNALIAIAENTGIIDKIKTPFRYFPNELILNSKVSSVIKQNIKKVENSDLSSLKTLTSIFEHMKEGKIAIGLANLSKKIDNTSFTDLNYGRFYEIIRNYKEAIYRFLNNIDDKNISLAEKIQRYCSAGFCESVIGRFDISNKYYVEASKLAPKNLKGLGISLCDQLLRGKAELYLKILEVDFNIALDKKEKIFKEIEGLLNELENIIGPDTTRKALILKNRVHLKILQAKTLQDFRSAKELAKEAYYIMQSRNQFEGQTVVARILLIADPKDKESYKIVWNLIKETCKRKYKQEFYKLIFSFVPNIIFRNPIKVIKLNALFKKKFLYKILNKKSKITKFIRICF